MKKSLKKLLCGFCALAVSATVLTGVAFADENTVDSTLLPETVQIYDMIKDPATSETDLDFMASTFMAQGILGDVVYQLMEYTDAADLNTKFFENANALFDAPTAAVLGNEDLTDVPEEATVVSTKVIKHTFELDKAAGLIGSAATEENYGAATSVVQKFAAGSKAISSINWKFITPGGDNNVTEITATKEENSTYKLPNVAGNFTIGIILNNWVNPDAERETIYSDNAAENDFVTTTFTYEGDTTTEPTETTAETETVSVDEQ